MCTCSALLSSHSHDVPEWDLINVDAASSPVEQLHGREGVVGTVLDIGLLPPITVQTANEVVPESFRAGV